MASETTKKIFKEVRPILSLDRIEARRRVISLYKAWYRQIPYIVKKYDVPFSVDRCRKKLREEFTKYSIIPDIRVIDMLVIRGKMDLDEFLNKWIQNRGVGKYFKDHIEPKPNCFFDKFLDGKN